MELKKILYAFSVCAFLLTPKSNAATNDSTLIKVSGYVDAYYAYYTDSVGVGKYQKFPSISPRTNSFGLNSACITAQYDGSKVRGIVTLHYGDIPVSAWSGTFNNIMEAHAGVRLGKKCWLDAGFFRTHTGAEGLLPKENFTSSVSVSTFFEPYFESGIRLNYLPNTKWSINIFALNGYNIYEDNNEKKSIGMLATYSFNENGNIGYSNYIGDDTPKAADSISHLRIFQNLFFNYQFKKLKMQLGIDNIMQGNSDITDPKKSADALSGVLSFKYQFSTNYAIYSRGEFFNDPQGFMGGVITDKKNKLTGIKLFGITLGTEYKPTDNTIIRLEGRELVADKDQEIFRWNGENKKDRLEIMLNIGVSF